MFFPFESIVSFKLDKVIGQATVFPGGLYSSSFGFFMNQDKWNKLSKQDQDDHREDGSASTPRAATASPGTPPTRSAWTRSRRPAPTSSPPTPAMQAEAKKRSGPIIEDWIKKASAKVPNAKAILDEFHAELKKVAAGK